ncbi:hypothetical protein GCM10010255_79260 [Streptomyces coeruleofuscus]|uniref:Uncharacterized protein n=1 Tax=Streptomyces coeruleofuscus TaxID=66879 RepID=A0ABP5WEF4_9ACTN
MSIRHLRPKGGSLGVAQGERNLVGGAQTGAGPTSSGNWAPTHPAGQLTRRGSCCLAAGAVWFGCLTASSTARNIDQILELTKSNLEVYVSGSLSRCVGPGWVCSCWLAAMPDPY